MSKPIENSEQLPVAWVYPEFMKNIKDAKCWTAYATYHEERPIPLYTHPMRELSEEEILKCANKIHARIPNNLGNDFLLISFAKELFKKASEK